MISSEQTSGEGCSANVPTRKSLGRFVLGRRPLQSGLTALIWHHRDVPNFAKCAMLSRRPTWHGVSYRNSRRSYAALPQFVVLFLRHEGAMRPRSIAPLVAQSRKGCAISISSKARAAFLIVHLTFGHLPTDGIQLAKSTDENSPFQVLSWLWGQ